MVDTSDDGGVVYLAVPTCRPASIGIGSGRMEEMGCCRARPKFIRPSVMSPDGFRSADDMGCPQPGNSGSAPAYLQRGMPAPPAPSLSDLKADLPYGRLKKALQSGS